MGALKIVLEIVMILTSVFLIMTVLMHKGKGGGLSDMFGGGISTVAGSSGVAERNLNRITIVMALLWATSIILIGLIQRFAGF